MSSTVIYCSRTGNTRRISTIISNKLSTTPINLRNLPDDWTPSGLIVIGTGIYFGKPPKSLVKWLYSSPSFRGKRAAVFVTAKDEIAGKRVAAWIAKVLKSKGAKVSAGSVFELDRFWMFRRGYSTENEIEKANKFAKKIAPRKVTKKSKIVSTKTKKKK